MPKRIADTDAFKQIEEHIGSGPYIFKRDEFKPGDKAVYLKNTKYVPRSEPPVGTTGGKRVYVDRVEWNLALRDAQAQVNALQKGEVDIIEALGFDFYEAAQGRPEHPAAQVQPTTACSTWRASTTCTSPSTTRRCARRRSRPCSQEPFLRAQVGVKELYKPCASHVHLRHALRQPGRQRPADEEQHEEGAGPAEGQRLRRHADRAS